MSLLRQDSVHGRGGGGGRSEIPQNVLQMLKLQQNAGQVKKTTSCYCEEVSWCLSCDIWLAVYTENWC